MTDFSDWNSFAKIPGAEGGRRDRKDHRPWDTLGEKFRGGRAGFLPYRTLLGLVWAL